MLQKIEHLSKADQSMKSSLHYRQFYN